MAQDMKRFLDESGRLIQLPAKQATRLEAFAYLAEKFETDKDYSEQDVNAIISRWHTFDDYFVLRRGLIDSRFLCRLPNGSKYWKPK